MKPKSKGKRADKTDREVGSEARTPRRGSVRRILKDGMKEDIVSFIV